MNRQAPIALDAQRDGAQRAPNDVDGRDHDMHHHGPAHRGRRHDTSGAGPATAREGLLQLQREQELIERLGAWVPKQGFLHWVLLWDCASVPRKGLPAGMDPYCSPGVPRALHSGWLHSGAAASRHRDPAASEAQQQTAGHAVLCRVRVPERCGA